MTLFFLSAFAHASAQYSLTLSQAESAALIHSSGLKSQQALIDAAQSQQLAADSLREPKLSVDATYYYQTHVSSKTLGSLGTFTFGDNNNFYLGPNLSYTLYDGGVLAQNAQAAENLVAAREMDLKTQTRWLRLQVQLAYFRVQLGLSNLLLTANALKLAQAQSSDIDLRYKAGAASRLDQISARKNVLAYQLKFTLAQNDLANTLRDLFALMGEKNTYDTARVGPAVLATSLPEGLVPFSLLLDFEPLEKSLKNFVVLASPGVLSEHPQIKALQLYADASKTAATGQQAVSSPKVQVFGKSQVLYPDGVVQGTAINNVVTLMFTLPVLDGHLQERLTQQKLSEAKTYELQADDKLNALQRDYAKAQDALQSLKTQQDLNSQMQQQAQEIAQLTYQAYQAGRVNFLDVENANLHLLEAKVDAARTTHQMLIQLATLNYLAPSTTQKQGDTAS